MPEVPTILTASLPGERVLDPDLIARAVADINRLHAQKSLELALQIGQIVVDYLFGGDLAAAESRARGHVSYRALAEHPEISVSHSHLQKCVRVLVLAHQLSPELSSDMSFSHHVALLPVRDARDREALAQQSVSKGWTAGELRTAAQRVHRKATRHRAGRPPLPDFMKQLRSVVRASEKATSARPLRADVEQVKPEQARALLVELEGQLEALTALKAHVLGHLEVLEERRE